LPVTTSENRTQSVSVQGVVEQAGVAAKRVSAEARRHQFELLVLAATMGFVLIVAILALAVLI
jgi:hypothetical protein